MWCCNCLQYRLKHSSLLKCFNALTLTSHYYRQWFAHFWLSELKFGCSFKMSDYWWCCACNEAWRFIRICLKIVNITGESALYYATLARILWTWCKIWDKWHDGLSFVWFSMPLFIFCIVLCIYIYAFSRHFYPKQLSAFRLYIFWSVHVFPGNRTHNLCAANAMLYHWATGTVQHRNSMIVMLLSYCVPEFVFLLRSTEQSNIETKVTFIQKSIERLRKKLKETNEAQCDLIKLSKTIVYFDDYVNYVLNINI